MGGPSTRRRIVAAVGGACALGLLFSSLVACSGSDGAPGDSRTPGSSSSDDAEGADVRITSNVGPRRPVPVSRIVAVEVDGGSLTAVTLRSRTGDELVGELAEDGSGWTASARLEPGTSYVVTSVAESDSGERRTVKRRFRTVDLSLDQQIYPSIAPLAGETVGVGMPVIVSFDLPVTDRAAIEKHLSVESVPAQRGGWRWISDSEVHWRPAKYWKPGTEVTVNADINSVPAGGGKFGQESRTIEFSVGDAHVYKVNARTHQMAVWSNGEMLRRLPVTMGKDGFITRSGTKVIMEKFRSRRMRSETIGIGEGSADYYDLDNVEYAMRLTYSGEFIHAAPWSVGSQGNDNVSHGCTGMSTSDAQWLYDLSQRGDVVEYAGTDRRMTLENGYGDWNLSFPEWKRGSALA